MRYAYFDIWPSLLLYETPSRSLCTVRKINLLPRLILGDSVSQSFAICVIVYRNSLDLKLVTCVPAKINNNNNPEVQKILKSALSKLSELENAYNSLKKDLVNSGTDKRVIHAMVQNLQNRMELLKNVQLQLDEIN